MKVNRNYFTGKVTAIEVLNETECVHVGISVTYLEFIRAFAVLLPKDGTVNVALRRSNNVHVACIHEEI